MAPVFPVPLSVRPSGILLETTGEIPEGWWVEIENYRSRATPELVRTWQSDFFFPKTVRVRVPSDSCRAFEPGVGWLVVYKDQLLCGLRFPPHPFVRELAQSHQLAVNQFSPNTYCHINCYLMLCALFGVDPSIHTFLQYYKINVSPRNCFYYFSARGSSSGKYNFVCNCPTSRKGWHQEYFFMEPDVAWRLKTSQKVGDLPDVQDPLRLLEQESAKANYTLFNNKLRGLVPWFGDGPEQKYPMPVYWKLITQGVLSHLGIIRGDLGELGIRESPPSARDMALIERLRGEISLERFNKG